MNCGGRGEFQGFADPLAYAGEIAVDRCIGEANKLIPLGAQRRFAGGVTLMLLIMNRPVKFDNQPLFGTVEVDDEAPKRVLATKLVPR
jgi:hypothetical protein